VTIEWVTPPSVLANNIAKYGERILVAVQAVATRWGQGIQDDARRNAPWEDRTGNARSGIFFAVDGFGLGTITGEVTADAKAEMSDVTVESGDKDTLIVTLGHSVFYGRYLELSNGGRYAIIMSTIEANLGDLERMVRELLR
jgi:hypothetical protein